MGFREVEVCKSASRCARLSQCTNRSCCLHSLALLLPIKPPHPTCSPLQLLAGDAQPNPDTAAVRARLGLDGSGTGDGGEGGEEDGGRMEGPGGAAVDDFYGADVLIEDYLDGDEVEAVGQPEEEAKEVAKEDVVEEQQQKGRSGKGAAGGKAAAGDGRKRRGGESGGGGASKKATR